MGQTLQIQSDIQMLTDLWPNSNDIPSKISYSSKITYKKPNYTTNLNLI